MGYSNPVFATNSKTTAKADKTKDSSTDKKEPVQTNHANSTLFVNGEDYGKELHQQLKQMGYELWTPYRKNMTGAKIAISNRL